MMKIRYGIIGLSLLVGGNLPLSAWGEPTLPALVGNLRPHSRLIGCDQADQHHVLRSESVHLDPRCQYTGGFELTRGDSVLDCRGATIVDPEGDDQYGVSVHGGTNFAIRKVTVRNCIIDGFESNFRVSRDGFRDLQPGREYVNSYARIELRNSRLRNARGNGVYIDGYVTGVSIRDCEIADSAQIGIFLESGSRNNKILRNYIHDNGYGNVDPAGIPFFVSDVEFRFLSTGREGLSLDGSSNNRIVKNRFERNSFGGIHLYKSCGEFSESRPELAFPRRFGSDGNRIRQNVFSDEPYGIWVGSRASQNQLLQECSDDPYVSGLGLLIYEDKARSTRIQSNTFHNVAIGVRVEDDFTRVERNSFNSAERDHVAVVIGTQHRSNVLGEPVRGTVLLGNRANLGSNAIPYFFVYDIDTYRYERNRALGFSSLLHKSFPPRQDVHLFIREFWLP